MKHRLGRLGTWGRVHQYTVGFGSTPKMSNPFTFEVPQEKLPFNYLLLINGLAGLAQGVHSHS
jgi:hypothetical protein